jgi:hypothetical protein
MGIYYHELIQLTRVTANHGLRNEQELGKSTSAQLWNRRSSFYMYLQY